MSLQHANENSKKAMIAKKISESNLHSFQELEDLFDEFDASNGKALPKQEEEIGNGKKRITLPIFGEETPDLQLEEEIEITEENLMEIDEEILAELNEEDLELIYNKEYNLLSDHATEIIKNAIKENSELNKERLQPLPVIPSHEIESGNDREKEETNEDLLEKTSDEEDFDDRDPDEESLIDEDDFSTLTDEEIDIEFEEEFKEDDENFEEHNLLGIVNKEESKPEEKFTEKPSRTPKDEGFREIDDEKIKNFFKNLFKRKDKNNSSDKSKPAKEKKGFFGKKNEKQDEQNQEKEKLPKKKIKDEKKSSNIKKIIGVAVSLIIVLGLVFLFFNKGSSFKSMEEIGLVLREDLLTLKIPFPEDDENYTGSMLIYLTLEEENEKEEITCESDIVDITIGEEISAPMNCSKDLNEEKKYKIKTLESNYF